MDGLRIIAPGRNVTRDQVRREHDVAERARDLEMRASAMLHEIAAQVGEPCHWCGSGLYSVPDTGCPACKPGRNGAATVVNHRSGGYPDRAECRSPVEIRGSGAILSIR